MKLSKGFSAVEIVIVAVVLVIVGAVGYVAWNKFAGNSNSTADVTTKTKTADEQTATPIKSTKDLDKAVTTLDDTSLDDSDAAAAEQQASF